MVAKQTLDIHLTDEGIRLDDGGWIAWPECDGTIRRFDRTGHWMETIGRGDAGHDEWLALFPLDTVVVEYTATYRTTLRLPKGRYQLQAELDNITPPEDPCHQPVSAAVVRRVVKNGQELAVPADRPVV
jgi:hypothetical protein